MVTGQGLRTAFILGFLVTIPLIIVYWYQTEGLNFNQLRNPKQNYSSTSRSYSRFTSRSHTSSSSTVNTTTSRTTLVPEVGGGAGDEHGEEERRSKQEQKKEETRDDVEKERSNYTVREREQEMRKRRITDMCSGREGLEFPGRTRAFEQIPDRDLNHLIVDDKHRIIYCYVPKVACTNWKRVMVVLSQSLISPSSGKPYTDPQTVPADLVHKSSIYLTFANFWNHDSSLSRQLMELKLQNYTKFLFVRDPFVRLISVFRNKFEKPNEKFYRSFGLDMIRRYGNVSGSLPKSAAEAFSRGIKPTFQQFISYLIDPVTERKSIFNEHWRQVYRLCHPCQVKYDFIGQVETLETDAKHLLKLLEVDDIIHFPSIYKNPTTMNWERDWFSKIPIKMRRKLYQLYEPDFKLFGYPKPDSVLLQ
ncbi:carbohydrate sulfotransferase 12-like isoform X1 [Antennarius striatus]|uniref:carbohydrate sulfotransferase 12-like isoform X1 n=1 Tax=Antennarius striatus TaxID=241820 RepID=UPI0035ADCCEF